MNLIDQAISEYAEAHTSPEPELLRKINRDTYANVLMPRMLSGHLQGRVLAMFAQMVRPRRVLEIGTFTGYSALCFAEGLTDDGILYTIDINEELESRVRSYFESSDKANQIKYFIGNALEVIPTLDETFDIVFIDADKINYQAYYELVFDKVRPGGFIIADNVLWSGKIVQQDGKKPDKDTQALLAFNAHVQADTRVENLLLPVRDGLLIARKR